VKELEKQSQNLCYTGCAVLNASKITLKHYGTVPSSWDLYDDYRPGLITDRIDAHWLVKRLQKQSQNLCYTECAVLNASKITLKHYGTVPSSWVENKVIVKRKKKKIESGHGPQRGAGNQTNWSTDCRPQTNSIGCLWLRLALSKGPNSLGVFFPSPEERTRSSLRNVAFSNYLYRTMGEVHNPNNSECCTTSLEPFRLRSYCCFKVRNCPLITDYSFM
jgi:hypothetical protein